MESHSGEDGISELVREEEGRGDPDSVEDRMDEEGDPTHPRDMMIVTMVLHTGVYDEEIFEEVDREEASYESKRSIPACLDTLREDVHECDGDHRPSSECHEVGVDVFGDTSVFEEKSREAQEDEECEGNIDHNAKRLVVVSGIFADLFGSVELFEEDEEGERMRESHGGERYPLVDRGSENRLVYPVRSRDEENDIGVGILEALYGTCELFGRESVSIDVAVDDEAFGSVEIFADASALFATDHNRISRGLRFDVFEIDLSFEASDIFSDRLSEVTVRISNSDDMEHKTDYILGMFCT